LKGLARVGIVTAILILQGFAAGEISNETAAVLSLGWDANAERNPNKPGVYMTSCGIIDTSEVSGVTWNVLDDGRLVVKFVLNADVKNHRFLAGAHFFDPGGRSGGLPGVCEFGGWKVTCGRDTITREGRTATVIGAWDFGYLDTGSSGDDARVQFTLTPPSGTYYLQFTVRCGDTCSPSTGETEGCPVIFHSGEAFGEGLHTITIPPRQGQSAMVSQKVFSVEKGPSKRDPGAPQASTQPPMPQTQAGNALYIDAGIRGTARFVSASQHSKLTLIAETPIGGQGEVFELYPTSGDQTTYAISAYNFNPGKNNLQYSAEVPGMHYLFVSINKQPSNVIIIEVQGGSGTGNGLGQPLSFQSNPSKDSTGSSSEAKSTMPGTILTGGAEVTAISSWLKGYSIEVDGIQVGVDGSSSDAPDGVFKFYVTGDQQHSIKVNHPQFWKSWNDFFMASGKYTANIDVPGRVVQSG
jgi:hypothetical protein